MPSVPGFAQARATQIQALRGPRPAIDPDMRHPQASWKRVDALRRAVLRHEARRAVHLVGVGRRTLSNDVAKLAAPSRDAQTLAGPRRRRHGGVASR